MALKALCYSSPVVRSLRSVVLVLRLGLLTVGNFDETLFCDFGGDPHRSDRLWDGGFRWVRRLDGNYGPVQAALFHTTASPPFRQPAERCVLMDLRHWKFMPLL